MDLPPDGAFRRESDDSCSISPVVTSCCRASSGLLVGCVSRYVGLVHADFATLPFDLRSSPWLQRALNEDYHTVWGYWDSIHASFLTEKEDIEKRVDYVLEHNDHDKLRAWAAQDRDLIHGMSGPHRTVVDPDPLRVAAFRVVEVATWRAIGHLQLASLEPASENDFVCEQTPGLWPLLTERDRLLPLTKETWASECRGNVPYFVVGDRAVYSHPFVIGRRELVLDVLALGLDGLDVKIAVDPARTTTRADAADMLLADYWFGCTLTRETIDSLRPEDLGTTWHVRPPGRPTSFDTHPVVATVFRWQADKHVKKLEVIEIAPRDSRTARRGPYVVNRYLHALRDTRIKRFTHVDGAARAYAYNSYEATNDNPKGSCGNVLRYRKLFRADGTMDDADWGRVVAHFFRGNELVIEYFGELADERGWAPPRNEPPTSTVPAMNV